MDHADFKTPEFCSVCGCKGTLIKHGYYYRNIVDNNSSLRLCIPRFYCKRCKHTISVIPNFCVPHFQYSSRFILSALKIIFTGSLKNLSDGIKALFRFYRKRFIKNLPLIEMFLRYYGIRVALPDDIKKRAIKVYKSLISLPGEENLFQRFLRNFNKHFMAT